MKHNPLKTPLNKNNFTNKAFIVEVNLKLLHFLYHLTVSSMALFTNQSERVIRVGSINLVLQM